MNKKKALLIIIIIITTMLTGCKVEFPEKIEDSSNMIQNAQGISDSSLASNESITNSSVPDSSIAQTTSTVITKKPEMQTPISTTSAVTTQKSNVGTDKYKTDPIPEGKPNPVEPQNKSVNKDNKLTATLSISCKTILSNMDKFNKDKLCVLPEDGIIFSERQITFSEGESVFDVLLKQTKNNRIHMEFENTPIYNSAYIEGINNLYEFDCGNLSGWMYKVNGWFPNYGCSRYQLKAGDKIEWVYTCDLGRDVGGEWVGNSK